MKKISMSLNRKRITTVLTGGMLGIALVVLALNGYVLFKLNKLEKRVEAQQKELNRAVVEQVTEIIHDPIYMAGGSNKIETETLINTDELLSSEQLKALRSSIIDEVETYVTKDVYLGLQELMYEELNKGIHNAVEEITAGTLTDEQQEIIISTIQEKVLEETSASIKKISKEMTSNNKLIKALETTVTSLGKRVDTLESTLDTSVSELKEKDKELEKAINQLRLSFVEGSIGTADLQMLSVQMFTNENVLSECEHALKNNLTHFTGTEKDSYMEAIIAYREQLESIEKTISKALNDGGTVAGEELAASAAELSRSIVSFGNMIEEAKISLINVKAVLQEQIDELETSTRNNTSRITDLQQAKASLQAADNSLFAISEALQAADLALEQTSTDNLNTALTKITSLVGSIPEGSTVAGQLSQAQKELENAKANLETAIAEGNAEAIAEAENSAATALASARNEIETSIESIIGDIPDGETISSLFVGMDTNIDQVREDLTTANNNLSAAKSELEDAIASGRADAIAEAEEKVLSAKTELYLALTSAQNGLQSNIDTIEGQMLSLNNAVTEANAKIAEAENNISGLQTDVSSLETEVDSKASQSELQTTTETINQNLQEAKEDIDNALNETKDDINNSIANKADKSDLENVMKAKVSTDANGKTTITMIMEGE